MKDVNIHFYILCLSLVISTTILHKRNHSLEATSSPSNQTQRPKQVKKHQTKLTESNDILLPPIKKNQEPTTRPKSLSPDLLVLVLDFEYESLAKDTEKVSEKGKNTLVKLNISHVDFGKLALTKKKDRAIAILNFAKFSGYSYLLPTKRLREGWIWKHEYNI